MSKMKWSIVVVVSALGLSGCLKDKETAAALTETNRSLNVLKLEVGTLQDKVKGLSEDLVALTPATESFDAVSTRLMSLEGMAAQIALDIPADAWARNWDEPVPAAEPTESAAAEAPPAAEATPAQ